MSNIKIIIHNTHDYWKTIDLRTEVLRKPLGLQFSEQELSQENDSFHLAYFDEKQAVIGCLVLKPISKNEIKMRQVAVSSQIQKQGIGKKMVDFAEKWSKEQGFQYITLHARESAVPFYQKLNYEIEGNLFEEVGLPHFKMKKFL
jgi:predicted GNAT family N-acyltransferase